MWVQIERTSYININNELSGKLRDSCWKSYEIESSLKFIRAWNWQSPRPANSMMLIIDLQSFPRLCIHGKITYLPTVLPSLTLLHCLMAIVIKILLVLRNLAPLRLKLRSAVVGSSQRSVKFIDDTILSMVDLWREAHSTDIWGNSVSVTYILWDST